MEVIVMKVKFELYGDMFGFRVCLLRVRSLGDILRLAANYRRLLEIEKELRRHKVRSLTS